MADDTESRKGMFSELRIDFPGILALNIFLVFAGVIFLSAAMKVTIDADLKQVLITIVTLMVGFYFGSSVGSKTATSAIISQMAPAKNPPNPPTAVETQWWGVLTDAEKTAITKDALTDAKVNAFMVASQTGHASSADLAYLVVKKLLTSDRAAEIQAT